MVKMKIIVATAKGGMEDDVSPVFGRCQTFTVIEAEGNEIKNVEVVPNQFSAAIHGAGVQSAQWIVSQGAKAVISGNFGPNVTAILQQAGIDMIIAQGKVKDVVEKYLRGELKSSFSQAMQPPMPYPYYPMPFPYYYPSPSPPPMRAPTPSPMQMSREEELKMIEEELRHIEDLLQGIKKRVEELKGRGE